MANGMRPGRLTARDPQPYLTKFAETLSNKMRVFFQSSGGWQRVFGLSMCSLPGGNKPGPRGASRPGQDIMRQRFFHRIAWGKILLAPREARIQFWAKGSGDGCLAEARQPLRNPGFVPPMLSSPGRDAPLGLCDRVIFSLLPTREKTLIYFVCIGFGH